MASTHTTLDAAATERKARLAKLAALKRKQPEPDSSGQDVSKQDGAKEEMSKDVTSRFLSGRNYDPETRGPKLGFEHVPIEGQTTLEEQAAKIAISTEQAAKEDEEADKPIDLFKLQPKKPNWDLKRDLDEKMKIVNVRTQNAIARLVRERIQNAQREAREKNMGSGGGDGDGQEVGMDGGALVEGIHLRERDEAEEERREREEDDEME
ncbi:hypothetical protein PAAG_00380 [Paracoccidioides lutzii Pb01]|uniref:Uncharacterized protein n=1 Tax=Paracoccidioides lutzii (strain ATCC MYA-826 / Pb01) TaxID=502779 RepID=C1GPD5_PARBA|nr:hypothetical protein PAAG_00380 [Paracoccidioides lutzii Pb01]EEH36057.1 hypothetical protein PAAG_00380 [Paracoccidioides lutzii Pb01]